MHEKPLVSIIITTYKRPKYLVRAIESVLNQTYTNIEVLVVDDNDPDTEYREYTEELMEQFSDIDKVKYIKHEYNKNGAAARNTGIFEAKGKYVTFLDDDDEYRFDKVAKQVDRLEKSNFNAVYCGWNREGIDETPTLEGNLLFEALSGELLIRTNTIMMTTATAREIGGWDESYRRHQEIGLLSRYFMAGYEMGVVTEPVVIFDTDDRSNASTGKKYEEDFLFMLHDQEEAIAHASKIAKRNKNIIYSYRLRSIALRYLVEKDFIHFFRSYIFSTMRFPLRYNIDLFSYIFKKICQKAK